MNTTLENFPSEQALTRRKSWLDMSRKTVNKLARAAPFLLPGLLLYGTFILLPMLYSLRVSFFDWKVLNPVLSTWVGIDNYTRALADPVFQRASLNTVAYALITVPAQLVLGLGVALLLNQSIRGKAAFRVIYYLPVITSWVIVSLLFEYMFSGQAGLINYLLRDVLGVIDENILWLADPVLVFVPIDLLEIWKGVGWAAVIFLAGLQSIPVELEEAAEVDGAGTAQRFFRITLPMLRPTLVFLIVVRTIGALNAYISNLLITNGGDPLDKTHFVLTLMYEATFARLDFGYGSAISYLLAAVIFVISIFQIRLLRQRAEV
jgi:multiple sugar transport system permease protein